MERSRFVPQTTQSNTPESCQTPQSVQKDSDQKSPHRRTIFDWMRSKPVAGAVGALSTINLTFGTLHEAEAKTTKKTTKTTKKPTRRTTTTLKKRIEATSTTQSPTTTVNSLPPTTTLVDYLKDPKAFSLPEPSELRAPYTNGPYDINDKQCWLYYKAGTPQRPQGAPREWKHLNGSVEKDVKFNSRGCVYITNTLVLNSMRLYTAPANQYLVVADDGAEPMFSWGVEFPNGGFVVNAGQWEEAVKKITGGDGNKVAFGKLQKAIELLRGVSPNSIITTTILPPFSATTTTTTPTV